MSSSQDPLGIVGTVVDGKYQVEAVIGEGGFSVVYRAEHIIWKQPVALKCFNALAGVPAAMRQDLLNGFIQEGKLMTNLSSRTAAIVQARDVGTLTAPRDGAQVPFMVIEWLEAGRSTACSRWSASRVPARSIYDVLALLERSPARSRWCTRRTSRIATSTREPLRDRRPAQAGAFVKILDFAAPR